MFQSGAGGCDEGGCGAETGGAGVAGPSGPIVVPASHVIFPFNIKAVPMVPQVPPIFVLGRFGGGRYLWWWWAYWRKSALSLNFGEPLYIEGVRWTGTLQVAPPPRSTHDENRWDPWVLWYRVDLIIFFQICSWDRPGTAGTSSPHSPRIQPEAVILPAPHHRRGWKPGSGRPADGLERSAASGTAGACHPQPPRSPRSSGAGWRHPHRAPAAR